MPYLQTGRFAKVRKSMRPPNVLISILNWNGGAATLECLSSVFKMDYGNYQVLVIDNASTDDSLVRIESEYPQVKIVRHARNQGFAGGQNRGMQYAIDGGFDYVWVLNNDTAVNADSLAGLVGRLDVNEQVAAVSPLIATAGNGEWLQFCGCHIDWEQHQFKAFHTPEESLAFQKDNPALICLWGTAVLLRTSVLRQVGLFDEKFFAYYEDMDISVRISAAGFRNEIITTTRVFHAGIPDATARPLHYLYYMVRNGYFFWMKHLRGGERRCYRRKFIAQALREAAEWRDKGDLERMHTALLAMVHALNGQGGPWVPGKRLPERFVKTFMAHPYLISSFLLGRFRNIAATIADRLLGRTGDNS